MIRRQPPFCLILLGAQSVLGLNMTPEHVPSPSTFQANDVGRSNRLPDRNSGLLWGWLRCFPKRHQGLMHGGNERGHVSGLDVVLLDVLADDLSYE